MIDDTPRSAKTRYRRTADAAAPAALVALALTLAALAARPLLPSLPESADYTEGYAPAWVTGAAAVLGGFAALAATGRVPAPRRTVLVCGWAGGVLMLWSAAGVVLDGFRAFFAITGIPAGGFSQVDWSGMLVRALSLAAAALVAAATAAHHRRGRGGCPSCGRSPRDSPERSTAWMGYAAFGLGLPYPALKLYWSLGGSLFRPESYHGGFPAGEILAAAVGAAVCLALVRPWGRRLPRRLPLTAAFSATAILLSMGALSLFGSLAQLAGITEGPVDSDSGGIMVVSVVYGGWLLFGLTLGGAALAYQRATRPACAECVL